METTKTLRRELVPELPSDPALLAVVVGGELRRRSVALRGTVSVGRGQDVSLVLEDAALSRRHFAISRRGAGWTLADAGSRNGTYLFGARVLGDETPLEVGDALRAAASLFVVVADAGLARDGVSELHGIVGGGALSALRRRISLVSAAAEPALVLGETGTGKELVARALHTVSGNTGAFVAANCAAIPEPLFESELFGHSRGAYSGASGARAGLVRSAEGGTLFLDEVGELPLPAQAKLLRFLEDRVVRPVGEDRGRVVSCRIVCATHKQLEPQVEAGRFRADLMHRLSGALVHVPSLDERREDIPALAAALLAREGLSCRSSVDVLERLLCARWPGNVRQLRNVVVEAARRAAEEHAEAILLRHLPASFLDADEARTPAPSPAAADGARATEVRGALESARGNVAEAARALGMRRATLYEVMKRLDIDPRDHR